MNRPPYTGVSFNKSPINWKIRFGVVTIEMNLRLSFSNGCSSKPK